MRRRECGWKTPFLQPFAFVTSSFPILRALCGLTLTVRCSVTLTHCMCPDRDKLSINFVESRSCELDITTGRDTFVSCREPIPFSVVRGTGGAMAIAAVRPFFFFHWTLSVPSCAPVASLSCLSKVSVRQENSVFLLHLSLVNVLRRRCHPQAALRPAGLLTPCRCLLTARLCLGALEAAAFKSMTRFG